MVNGFRTRLTEAVRRRGTSLCVGIDPRGEWLPEEFAGLEQAEAYARFGRAIIDAVADVAVAVKPQSAFFEASGWRGVRALEEVCRHARERGLLVVGDVKRGDIGSTAAAYATAAFDEPLFDAVTVNPYLGRDSIEPFVARARETGSGVFVLLRTSNPSSSEIQELALENGPLYLAVARLIASWSEEAPEVIGAVVGATQPGPLREIRDILPDTWLLVPGLGVQGGNTEELLGAVGNPRRLLVNLSRNICFPWRFDEEDAGDWRGAIHRSAVRWSNALREPSNNPQ